MARVLLAGFLGSCSAAVDVPEIVPEDDSEDRLAAEDAYGAAVLEATREVLPGMPTMTETRRYCTNSQPPVFVRGRCNHEWVGCF